MNGVWLENRKLSLRRDLPVPVPPEGEALVRVTLAGICNTDLELVKGYYPFAGIPGHEFTGIIETVPGGGEREGERVTGSINAVCHRCDLCRRGMPGHCRKRSVLGIAGRDGVFAEYVTLPLENLHPIPGNLPDSRAVFAEPLAAALRICEQLELQRGERIIVVGAGKLGQLISETLLARGYEAESVPKYQRQRSRLEELGIVCRAETDCVRGSYDIVIEATGSPSGLDLALDLVRPRGTMVLKSTYQGKAEVDLSKIVVDEISILGSRCGSIPHALELLASGRIRPESTVDRVYSLGRSIEAFTEAAGKGAGKVLIDPRAA